MSNRNDRMMEIQMEQRDLSIRLEQVEPYSEEYYKIIDQKEKLAEEYFKIWGMSEKEIKEENKNTELNRDR